MNQTEPSSDREIRVFISSTFRDMHKERDLLVKEVFPELRLKCAERFVTFTEVDLRWGITEEQANNGQIIPLCLAEIERSRPYFIGLLGERYGWVPDSINPEVIEREQWLKEQVSQGISITELEILHGVLNNPKMAGHAYFYFRDPEYVNSPSLSEKERFNLIENDVQSDIDLYGREEAVKRTEGRKQKLAVLKHRIRDSQFPLVDGYENPKSLVDKIKVQFNELINELFPEEEVPSRLDQERIKHEAYANSKLFGCVSRTEHLKELNGFADLEDHEGKGMVVTGESGGGKTSLLSEWAQKWQDENPDDCLFQHYFGATPDSTSIDKFLRRLFGELKDRFDLSDEIPSDGTELREALPAWLAWISKKSRLFLVLDGLNQIQGNEPDRRLRFLQRRFPSHVTVIASCLEGSALETLRDLRWHEYRLPKACAGEIESMALKYLRIYARSLDGEILQSILYAPGANNPLFLRTVLDELRQFGSHELLPETIAYYLEAHNPKELFFKVIGRWKKDFVLPPDSNFSGPLVQKTLSFLWASRQGLSETEWLDLLGEKEASLPRALWSALFLAMEPHLCKSEGLYTYAHNYLRQAVEELFINDESKRKLAYTNISDYFESQSQCLRKTIEYPWSLYLAEDWHRLEQAMKNKALFYDLWMIDEYNLRSYMVKLYRFTEFSLEKIFRYEIYGGDTKPDINFLYALQLLLREKGAHQAVHSILGTLRWVSHNIDDDELSLTISHERAKTLFDMGLANEALSDLNEIIELCEGKAGLEDRLMRSLFEAGLILRHQKNYHEAIRYYDKCKCLAINLRDQEIQASSLSSLVACYVEIGDISKAYESIEQCEAICRVNGNTRIYLGLLHEKACYWASVGAIDLSLAVISEKETACRELGLDSQLLTALSVKGILLSRKGQTYQSLDVLGEGLQIAKENKWPSLEDSISNSIEEIRLGMTSQND